MSPELNQKFRRFVAAHSNAWIAECTDGVTDKLIDIAWDKSKRAESILRQSIEQLEAKANELNPR